MGIGKMCSYLPRLEICPFQAPILSSIHTYYSENTVKPPFSVRVENTPKSRFVYQNTADLHLTYWLVSPFKSSCFLLHIYPIRIP